MKTRRLFLGSFIDHAAFLENYENIRKQFSRAISGKWPPAAQLHITYKFLGDVDETNIAVIKGVLEGCIDRDFEIPLEFDGLGTFNIANPRILFLKVRDKARKLDEISDYIESALEKLDFAREKRKFTPHVTLSRIKSVIPERFSELMEKYSSFLAFSQSRITVNLIESTLTPTGPVYQII